MNVAAKITATTPGAQRIIPLAQTPDAKFVFTTYDDEGHVSGQAVGTISHATGMSELGNQCFAVDDTDGVRHYVSRYAFVIPQEG